MYNKNSLLYSIVKKIYCRALANASHYESSNTSHSYDHKETSTQKEPSFARHKLRMPEDSRRVCESMHYLFHTRDRVYKLAMAHGSRSGILTQLIIHNTNGFRLNSCVERKLYVIDVDKFIA